MDTKIRALLLAAGTVLCAELYVLTSPDQKEQVSARIPSAISRSQRVPDKGRNIAPHQHQADLVSKTPPPLYRSNSKDSPSEARASSDQASAAAEPADDDRAAEPTPISPAAEFFAEARDEADGPLSDPDSEALVQEYEQALLERPGDVELHHSLVNAYLAIGDHEKGLELLRQGVMANATDPEFHLLYGNYLRMFERSEEAADAFRSVLVYDSENAEALSVLGEVYSAQGSHDLARQYQDEARRIWAIETGEVGDRTD